MESKHIYILVQCCNGSYLNKIGRSIFPEYTFVFPVSFCYMFLLFHLKSLGKFIGLFKQDTTAGLEHKLEICKIFLTKLQIHRFNTFNDFI